MATQRDLRAMVSASTAQTVMPIKSERNQIYSKAIAACQQLPECATMSKEEIVCRLMLAAHYDPKTK